jgi:hypothetical protein
MLILLRAIVKRRHEVLREKLNLRFLFTILNLLALQWFGYLTMREFSFMIFFGIIQLLIILAVIFKMT